MVADAGVLVTSVVTATEREIGTTWLYVDAGVYGGLAETLGEAIRYRITTTRDGDPTGTVVIAGPSCDSTDVMYEKSAYQLPVTLAEGDRLHLLRSRRLHDLVRVDRLQRVRPADRRDRRHRPGLNRQELFGTWPGLNRQELIAVSALSRMIALISASSNPGRSWTKSVGSARPSAWG